MVAGYRSAIIHACTSYSKNLFNYKAPLLSRLGVHELGEADHYSKKDTRGNNLPTINSNDIRSRKDSAV